MAKKTNDEKDMPFDSVVGRLREVVAQLESGELSLESSLKAYEEGVGLARHGHSLLDAAEKRVEVLSRTEDGEPVATPLDPE